MSTFQGTVQKTHKSRKYQLVLKFLSFRLRSPTVKMESFLQSRKNFPFCVRLFPFRLTNYKYKQITVFPENSKRQTANVSAILIFADETEYSTPSDFHDLE